MSSLLPCFQACFHVSVLPGFHISQSFKKKITCQGYTVYKNVIVYIFFVVSLFSLAFLLLVLVTTPFLARNFRVMKRTVTFPMYLYKNSEKRPSALHPGAHEDVICSFFSFCVSDYTRRNEKHKICRVNECEFVGRHEDVLFKRLRESISHPDDAHMISSSTLTHRHTRL